MSHEQKTKAIDASQFKPVDAPFYSVGSMAVQATGNEFVLTFSRPVPLQSNLTGQMSVEHMLNQATVILNVSPQTAKDISLALAEAVAKHEKEYGEITTRYSKSLAGHAK